MPAMALCNHCKIVSTWKPRSKVHNPSYDRTNYDHYGSYNELEASAKDGCNLCRLLCYDISLFPVLEFQSRNKIVNWEQLSDDTPAFLRFWKGNTGIVLSLFNLEGQSGYGVYYWVGDSGVTGALPFGSTIPFPNLNRYPEKRWAQASSWLQTCASHPQCTVHDGGYVPTRLLDVGPREPHTLRLVETTDHQLPGATATDSKYVALSYCWGRSMPLDGITTVSKLASHLQGISIESLPRTLQDAINITRQLGVQYLWIDALCIIQNDSRDWQLESSSMSRIYSHAYFTIAAAYSSHCEGGMLIKQDPRQLLSVKLEHFSLQASRPTHRDLRDSSPLSSRAWTLQERELSPRIIWFTKHMMSFECSTVWASEAEPRGQEHPLNTSGVRDRSLHLFSRPKVDVESPGLNKMGDFDADPSKTTETSENIGKMYRAWRSTVQDYSSRQMTRISDKLPALSGLAHMVQLSVKSEYAAGIWTNDFLRGLLWRRRIVSTRPAKARDEKPSSPTESMRDSPQLTPKFSIPLRRLSDYFSGFMGSTDSENSSSNPTPLTGKKRPSKLYIAPSWSWASSDVPIDYRVAISSQRNDPAGLERSLNALVISIDVKPLGVDPMGEVITGQVKILGWIRSLRDWLATSREYWLEEEMRWDREDEEADGVMILSLMRQDHFLEDVPAYNGLLIKETGNLGVYRRVGLIKNVHASWLGEVRKKEIMIV